MKKLCAIVLVFAMLCSHLPATAWAATAGSGTCGENMYWSMDEAGTLTLSGTGTMDSYASVGKMYGATISLNFLSTPWGESATAAVIEDGVTHIGNGTFANDWNLRSLDIPDSVKAIGIYAFYDTGLKGEIVLPEGLTYLGEGAFSKCNSLTTVKVPDLVTSIGDRTFYECTALENITLGAAITSIGYEAFTGCTALTSIVIPEGVTSVNVRAFEGCTSLTEIKFTGNAPTFETYAFLDVTATVYYPADDATWTATVMQNYGGTITWEAYTDYIAEGVCGDNLTWKLKQNGELIISGTGSMYDYDSAPDSPFYKYKSSITSVQLPDGITHIGEYAFAGGYPNLEHVEIPMSVIQIREVAFGTGVEMIKLKYPGTMEQWNSILIFEYTYDCYYGAECSDGTILYKGVCGDNARFVVYGDGTLEITGTGKMKFYQYLYYESYWSGDDAIKKVVIGEGITSIAAYAFKNCKNLQSIEIPDTVTVIGSEAFYQCTSLTNVIIPDGVVTISDEAFYGCSSLASIKLGDSVANIYDSAFERCSSLSSVTFTGDAPYISNRNYYGAFQGVTTTAYYRAYNETWTADVMQNYGGTITWRSYVNYIEQGQCGDALYWGLTDDGVLAITGTGDMWDYTWDGDHSTAPWYSYQEQITRIVIESGATGIGKYAFSGCNSVTKATIAEGLTEIGYNAFSHCYTMTDIELPDSLVTIGGYAFEGCAALTSIHIPDSVTGIGENAFERCLDLVSVTFGENCQLETIAASVFRACVSLTSIAIPDSVTEIGDCAFRDCDVLTTISFGENSQLQTLGESVFESCESLVDIQLPDTLTKIGSQAFYGCSGLTAIHIPDNVVSIGISAFVFCYNMTSLTFGEDSQLKDIGLTAFAYCDSLISITLPDSVTTIGDYAFAYCGFDYIYFGPNTQLTSIGNYAFYESGIQNITIPDGVTNIGASAFENCTKLTSVAFGENSQLTTVGAATFKDCKALICMELPAGVTSIGENMFSGCAALAYVIIDSGVTSIGDAAFSGCYKLWHVLYKGTEAQWNAVFVGADNGCLASVLHHNDCTGDEITDLEKKLCAVCVANGYVPGGQCGDNLFWSLDTNGVLTITGTGAMYDFATSGNLQSWYVYTSAIQEVVIEEGATTIGEYAFYLCNNLSHIAVADTLTSIGAWAFASCSALAEITLPAGLTSIGDAAFRHCDTLKEIVVPNGITAIGKTTFYSCDSLANVVLPASLQTIGQTAFASCRSLTSIVIPEGVQTIAQFAFNSCPALTTITLPASLTSIEANAFTGCKDFWHVLFRGTEEQWAAVENADTTITKATVHFNCTGDEVVDPVNKICTICCVHEWADATCDLPATCSICGLTDGEALGHDWDEGTVTTESTCTDDGIMTYGCLNGCGETYTEAVAATGVHTEATREENREEATCGENGSYDLVTYCSVCGAELDRENKEIPATGAHTHGEWIVDQEATCTEEGQKHRDCTVCDATETETIAATGVHTEATREENREEATCGENGSYDLVTYCSVCGAELDRENKEIPATGAHTYGEWIVDQEATCTEEGQKHRDCTVCDATESGTIAATGVHTEATREENRVEATCGENGSYELVTYCAVCGAERDRENKEIPATGAHTYGEWIVDTEATCTKEGKKHRDCTVCDATESGTIAATGVHTEATREENRVEATCGENGSYDLVTYCSVCGAELDRENKVIPATGRHTQATREEDRVEATCGKDGSYVKVTYCSVCNTELGRKTEIIPATGRHTQATREEDRVEATCGKDGSYVQVTSCSVCNTELGRKTVIIPATGRHIQATREENRVEATCGADGSYELVTYCSTCGAELGRKTEVIPATGRHIQATREENREEATCGKAGSYELVTYCSVCGAELDRQIKTIPATGEHSYGEWITDVEATCTEDGRKHRDCTGCDASETATISMTGHLDAVKNHICDHCGEVLGQCEDADGDRTCDTCGQILCIRGDMNNDGKVDSYDAIYLLYFTFYPEDYPINQDGDFNGDGKVDSYDAIYLLYFTFYPEDYPLN